MCSCDIRKQIASIPFAVNRDAIKARRVWRWPLRARKPEPLDAEFKVVAEPTEKPTKKPGKSMRLIKGGE